MPLIESEFRQNIILGRYSFARSGEILAEAHRESKEQGMFFTISLGLQQAIYQKWATLLPSFSESVPDNWSHLVTPLSISHWMLGCLHFQLGNTEKEQSYQTRILLHLAAALRFTVPHCNPSAISTILFSLKNLEMARVKEPLHSAIDELLAQTISHIEAATTAKEWLTPCQLKEAYLGIKSLNDEWEKRAVISALLTHIEVNHENGADLSNWEISWVLVGIANMSTSSEAAYTLRALALHVCENAIKGQWCTPEELSRAIHSLRDFGSSVATEIFIHAFLPHLNTIIDTSLWLSPSQIICLIEGVESMGLTRELESFFDTLTRCIDKQSQEERIFTLEEIGALFYALRNKPFFPSLSRFIGGVIPSLRWHSDKNLVEWEPVYPTISGNTVNKISPGNRNAI